MGKKATEYNSILRVLSELHMNHPNRSLGQHLTMILADYKDLWHVSNKELLFATEKYQAELEFNIASPEDVDKVIKDAQDLTKLFEEEDYE